MSKPPYGKAWLAVDVAPVFPDRCVACAKAPADQFVPIAVQGTPRRRLADWWLPLGFAVAGFVVKAFQKHRTIDPLFCVVLVVACWFTWWVRRQQPSTISAPACAACATKLARAPKRDAWTLAALVATLLVTFVVMAFADADSGVTAAAAWILLGGVVAVMVARVWWEVRHPLAFEARRRGGSIELEFENEAVASEFRRLNAI